MAAMRLLLVEDDSAMQTTLLRALGRRGLRVHACGDGREALARWLDAPPDVVLLDLSLPGMDGLQVLAAARKAGLQTPVLILTARGTVGDKILGLNAGADDYLPKPFDLDELEARLRALARRSAQNQDNSGNAGNFDDKSGPSAITAGALRYEKESGAVYHNDQALDLSPRELALLRPLLAQPGHAVTKERLFELVFPGAQEVQFEAIEVIAYRLRKKLAATGVRLMTLRGLGYLLKVNA